jgi:hypothetical protein
LKDSEEKIVFIAEDNKILAEAYKDLFEDVFPKELVLEIKDNVREGKSFVLDNIQKIKIAILDGELLDGPGYEIALAMRQAGFKGKIFLASGKDAGEVVPKIFLPLFTKTYHKDNLYHMMQEVVKLN